jgi:phosphoribosyl 1,2-cyclic phosphodiesterase
MRATIWGCRGTLASPGPETVRYGGQTSCIVLDLDDGSLLILDAGTGIRRYGMSLAGRHVRRVDLLITHLHTDHIEGLRFFPPFLDPTVEFRIWGPPAPLKGLEQRLAPFFSPPFFPVHLRNIPSRPRFLEVPTDPWTIGSALVSAQSIKHPGPAVGYRIEEAGRTVAYLPDHEPALGQDLATIESRWISGLGLARDADLLVHDGQYTADEYETRVGWGHSCTADALMFAARAGARRLALFHHDPLHTDEQLDAMLAETLELPAASSIGVELGHEGRVFELTSTGVS